MSQLICVSRSGQRIFYVEEAAFEATEKWYTHTGLATFSEVKPCETIFIDGGGAVYVDEPTVEVNVNDVNISTFKRHIPFVLEVLSQPDPPNPKIPGCVMVGGFTGLYVLTNATRNLLIEALKNVYKSCQSEIDNLEEKMFNDLTSAGVAAMGKCSCQSGLPYAKCCGNKAVME